MALLSAIYHFALSLHFADIGIALLTIDKGLERLFPNASIFKKVDSQLSGVGVKDVDGQ